MLAHRATRKHRGPVERMLPNDSGPDRHRGPRFCPSDPLAAPGDGSTAPGMAVTRGTPVTAIAIPYFQWDNRDGRAMRVWMPR